MNTQLKGFQISLAIHLLVLIAVGSLSASFASNTPVLIDFVLEESQEIKKPTPSGNMLLPASGGGGCKTAHSKSSKPEYKNPGPSETKKPEKTKEKPSAVLPVPLAEPKPAAIPAVSVKPAPAITEPAPFAAAPVAAGAVENLGTVSGQMPGVSGKAHALEISGSGKGGSGSGFGSGAGSGTGPGNGSGEGSAGGQIQISKEMYDYIRQLINRKLSYPRWAQERGWEGKVTVTFHFHADGKVSGTKVLRSSGFPILDNCAVEAVRKAAPLPKPPREGDLRLPIIFSLSS